MNERMVILRTADVITEYAYQGLLSVIKLLNQELALDPENEQYQMAMTHLARATDRIRSGEAVQNGLDPELLLELAESEHYSAALKMNEQICLIMGLEQVPEEENSFLMCNILSLYESKYN